MVLTKMQEDAVNTAIARFKAGEKYVVISGYAGSGKTTIVRFIVSALDIPEEKLCFATFTGKAAQVLFKKGNKNALTLHKLLYKHQPMPDGSYLRIEKDVLEYDVVVVDECSMAPKEMMDLLFKKAKFVICLGDPFQLPPINKSDDNHLLDKPHIFLSEIHRQALESEIIRVSMDIRNYKPLSLLDGQEVKVYDKSALSQGMMLWADQILCSTNKTRVELNDTMRQLLGKSGPPKEGDKIICLKNYWETLSSNQEPLINGTIGYLTNPYQTFVRYPYSVMGGGSFEVTRCDIALDTDNMYHAMLLDTQLLMTGNEGVSDRLRYALSRNRSTRGSVPFQFAYGYAVTVHKSQGSQWGKVLILEEKFPFDKETHARSLYTAITRAVDKAVIIKQ